MLADRALNGVKENVFYHLEEVARRRRYDSRLLLAHLARLDRLEGNRHTVAKAHGFDLQVAELARAPEREVIALLMLNEWKGGCEALCADAGFPALESVSTVSTGPGA